MPSPLPLLLMLAFVVAMAAGFIANTGGGCHPFPVARVGAELYLIWRIHMNVTSTGRDLRNRRSYADGTDDLAVAATLIGSLGVV